MRIDTRKAILVALVTGAGLVGCGEDEAIRKPADVGDAGGSGECEPRTCEEIDVECGEIDDGCGRSIECGEPCTTGQGGGAGAGPLDCADEVLAAPARNGRRANSSGFAAGDANYLELFDVACEDVATCVDACAERGGTEAMCEASECLPAAATGNTCVPAPIWGSLESIQVEDASVFDMTQIVLTTSPYQDLLLVDDFALDVPGRATIRGITVEVRRVGDASVADDAVRLFRAGQLVGADQGKPDVWSEEPEWVTYGGSDDTWGEAWSSADLRSDAFGVALSAQYSEDAGNTRAYIDQVRVTVSYSICE